LSGKVRLSQTFTLLPGEREVQILMSVTNISPTSLLRFPILDRYFDGDLDSSASDDRYDQRLGSVWGVSTPPAGVKTKAN
jgi:hypothetical protein